MKRQHTALADDIAREVAERFLFDDDNAHRELVDFVLDRVESIGDFSCAMRVGAGARKIAARSAYDARASSTLFFVFDIRRAHAGIVTMMALSTLCIDDMLHIVVRDMHTIYDDDDDIEQIEAHVRDVCERFDNTPPLDFYMLATLPLATDYFAMLDQQFPQTPIRLIYNHNMANNGFGANKALYQCVVGGAFLFASHVAPARRASLIEQMRVVSDKVPNHGFVYLLAVGVHYAWKDHFNNDDDDSE